MPEVGIDVVATDRAGSVLKKVGAEGSKNLGKIKDTVQKMPEQFSKAQGALLLFQNSIGQTGGKAAEVANKMTALIGLIATGGPLGIAIAAITLLVAAGAKAWEMFTSEVVAAQREIRAIEQVFATAENKLDKMRVATRKLSNELRFYGQDALTVAILKQWEMIEANERGLKAIEDELHALRISAVMIENLGDQERSHIANLLRIRDHSREVLAERKRALAQLEELANKQAEQEEKQERARRSAERKARADREAAKATREAAIAEREYTTLLQKRADLASEIARESISAESQRLQRIADLHEKDARWLDEKQQKRLEKIKKGNEEQLGIYASAASSMVTSTASILTDLESTTTDRLKSLAASTINIMGQLVADTARRVILANAAKGASGAMAQSVSLGPIGIIAAPAIATAVFGMIAALITKIPAFETGGMVGRTGAAFVHKAERIIDARRTEKLNTWIDSLPSMGGGGAASYNIHVEAPIMNPEEMTDTQIKRWLLRGVAKPLEELVDDGLIRLKRA